MAKLPVYYISRILQLKYKIEQDPELQAFLYAPLEGDELRDFLRRLRRHLPPRIDREALQTSCLHLLGVPLTPELLTALAWRLAANLHLLRNCQPVLPWAGYSEPEWVPVQIVRWVRVRNRRGKLGARFKFQILAGRPAGLTMQQVWITEFCRIFAADMGFTKWADSKYPFFDVRQLADLRLYVRMLPGTTEPSFDKLGFPPGIVTWNKVLIRRRSRLEFECPRRYPRDQYCHTCPAGRDQCSAAVHPRSYVLKNCPGCRKRAWFDNGELCVNCTEQEALTNP